MWRMERWLEYGSGTLKSSQDVSPPTTIEHLEDAIQVSAIPILRVTSRPDRIIQLYIL
jgi:hypothetical protein